MLIGYFPHPSIEVSSPAQLKLSYVLVRRQTVDTLFVIYTKTGLRSILYFIEALYLSPSQLKCSKTSFLLAFRITADHCMCKHNAASS